MVADSNGPHDPAQQQQLRSDGKKAAVDKETVMESGGGRSTKSITKFLGSRTPSSARGLRPSARSRALDDTIMQRLEDAEMRMKEMQTKNEQYETRIVRYGVR